MKLAEIQKQTLEELLPKLSHPVIKKLLKRAIPVWESEGFAFCGWGVRINDESVVKRLHCAAGCCLMGAAILNVKSFNAESSLDFRSSVWAVSGASNKERSFIMSAFDDGKYSKLYKFEYDSLSEKDKLLVDEVLKIREILLP